MDLILFSPLFSFSPPFFSFHHPPTTHSCSLYSLATLQHRIFSLPQTRGKKRIKKQMTRDGDKGVRPQHSVLWRVDCVVCRTWTGKGRWAGGRWWVRRGCEGNNAGGRMDVGEEWKGVEAKIKCRR